MNATAPLNRPVVIQKLASETFDLLVIGGGITGAGIALDAATRGFKVGLVEQHDFAFGTSSRSTKLIHGGLRYLKQLEFGLVKEVGSERAIVHRLAPHLVLPEKMLLPLKEGSSMGYWLTSIGLQIYDWLAGVKDSDKRKMLSRIQTLQAEPLLKKKGVKGGALYAEYRTDDARLTMEAIRTASAHGACCSNYLKAEDFVYEAGKISGINAMDILSGKKFVVRARMVVNATGPWVDQLRKSDGSLEGKRLHLTRGVHIVLDFKKLPVTQSVYFEGPDRRMIFAIPRDAKTYVGTTDTDFQGSCESVTATVQDVNYLLDAVNFCFENSNLEIRDVESSWAGLRPLIHEDGKSASELSRKDEVFVSTSGLISIAGGKLTGYRKMAERVVDQVVENLDVNQRIGKCVTDQIKLNNDFGDTESFFDFHGALLSQYPLEWQRSIVNRLVRTYGAEANEILGEINSEALRQDPQAYIKAEVNHTIKKEMVVCLADFYVRRTGLLYFDIKQVASSLKQVSNIFSDEFNWSEEHRQREISAMQNLISQATEFR
jgi:glycerol-3-phosphate dehydrogenase